jgi:hypothetical protein
VIGHPLVTPILPHLPWALGKYRLCDNTLVEAYQCIEHLLSRLLEYVRDQVILMASIIIHLDFTSFLLWTSNCCVSIGGVTTPFKIYQRSLSSNMRVTLNFQDRKLEAPSNLSSNLRLVDAFSDLHTNYYSSIF